MERLCLPESMDVVQGMRHFVRSFHELVSTCTTISTRSANANDADKCVERMVSSIQKYLASFYDVIASHPSFIEGGGGALSTETKMMLETFIYSKCHAKIQEGLTNNDLGNKEESELIQRLDFLQFINPSHLEIDCMLGENLDEQEEPWRKILSRPIMLLQSLDNMYSPAQMLRCILEVYRGVNDALKSAIEKGEGGARMPSADDVLPTLILTIICAKPKRIVINLRFLELFATQEQIRGEAGYAFTNLFSATQFIKELHLEVDGDEDGDSGGPSLHIAPEVMKEKLIKFRQDLEASRVTASLDEADIPADGSELEQITGPMDLARITIPVSEVTAARLRGEDLTEWAAKWVAANDSSALHTASGEETGQSEDKKLTKTTSLPLPEGFKRSYKFLATEANNIRLSDVPALLEEYRMLVRTTEILLMERNSMASKQHELEMKTKKESLDNSLAEVAMANGKENIMN